ncbi:MAG: vanadium-dependent haloperoxidase [Chthoniobacterales bacterium]
MKEEQAGTSSNLSRRKFLRRVGVSGVATAGGALGLNAILQSSAQAQDPGIFRTTRPSPNPPSPAGNTGGYGIASGTVRADRAYQIRVEAAQAERAIAIPPHPNNGDEAVYASRFASFSKGLRHQANGHVDPAAYNALMVAVQSGQFSDFEALAPHLGCSDPARQRPFVNPQSGYAFDLEGTDCGQLAMRPAPAFSSAEEASEMAELYWMALLRDVNFDDYATNPTAQAAAADLSQMSDFRGPKRNGQVTTQTLFRDDFPGCTDGPYISQFLLRSTAFGAQFIDQRIRARAPGSDYMLNFAEWLDVQNGCVPAELEVPPATEAPLRHIRNGRDISHYVRLDALFQAYFVAALYLINGVIVNETTSPFVYRFPFDPGNPYGRDGSTLVQAGFGTFGNPALLTLVTEPAPRALKAVWFQKWQVHRRLRPEVFGGRMEAMRLNLTPYPVHQDLLTGSSVLNTTLAQNGTLLLPQAFPEGSPLHPSYGSGHATVAGACVTMLKAFFDESTVIPEPLRINPADGGQTLVPYKSSARVADLTVGGELNKLASNIANGRNIAGVHWRTDAVESIKLGEAVALSMLQDMRATYNEPFGGFSLTKFDGTKITV